MEQIKQPRKNNFYIIVCFLLLILASTLITIYYYNNRNSTYFIDIKKSILDKVKTLSQMPEPDDKTAYDVKPNSVFVSNMDGFAMIDNSGMSYHSADKQEWKSNVGINNPIANAEGKYLIIAEKDGKSYYIANNKQIISNGQVDGQIYYVKINENGYSAVVYNKLGYKSAVKISKPNGEEIFTRFFSSTKVVSCDISDDNKTLAVGEIDISGIKLSSGVTFLSLTLSRDTNISNAGGTNNDSSIGNVISGSMEYDSLISNLDFKDKDTLLAVHSSKVIKYLLNGSKSDVMPLDNTTTQAINNSAKGYFIDVSKAMANVFVNKMEVHIISKDGKELGKYSIDQIIKEAECMNRTIAINTGTEIHIISTSGRLIKKIQPKGDIKTIKLFDNGSHIVVVSREGYKVYSI